MNNEDIKYGFLMIDYETPSLIKDIQNKIKKDELYIKDDEYGLEKETHVTLVPCLDNDTNLDEIKKYLNKLSEYKIILTDISKFECDDFDVLKCSAQSFKLYETNEKIKNKFQTYSEHKNYNPHLTIAYLKHGMADKYLTDCLSPLIILEPKSFHYSFWKNNEMKSEKFII